MFHSSTVLVFVLAWLLCNHPAKAQGLPTLEVSQNGRFLQDAHGRPFFWLGDTAWELFHRATRQEAVDYLDHRAANGFNVTQVVALAEFDGLNTPNAYGHRPLVNLNPAQPDVKEGPDNDYWDHVDFIIQQANARGIYVGLLPTWGDKWNKKWGVGPEVFTPENAELYGQWLGKRYANAAIVWILGGDRPIESDTHREIIRAMARGLQHGDGGRHLITYHPMGGSGSSTYFPNEPWLSFHMRQNGHAIEFTGRYDATAADYALTPPKPVIDAEPVYEGHPIAFDAKKFGHSIAADVRRPLYWNLFQGACGHTYGHHSIWQWASSKHEPVNNPLIPWTEALDQPGALQMQFGRRLLLSRPYFSRIPDPSLIVQEKVVTSVPGAGRYRFVATRDTAGSYAMIYVPVGKKFSVNLTALSADRIVAWWFDPRTGKATQGDTFEPQPTREFAPPQIGEALDWVLVLDDQAQGYPPPGSEN